MENENKGINLLTKVTSIRWFGWGLGETFLPVLFLMMSNSFLGTGFLSAVYNFVFLFSVPFAGYLADRIKIKYLIIFGLIMYTFIGISYFLAGFTGMIIFLVIAMALNGISYSFDQVGRETYFMRHTSKKEESEVFGRFDKITMFFWLLAVLIGLFLVKYVPIHWLLFAIAPTSVISLLLVLRLKERGKKRSNFENPYKKMLNEFKGFNKNLRTLAVIVFFFKMMSTIVYYFAPAVTYSNGESLVNSAMLILVYYIPLLFGDKLGKFTDKMNYKTYFLSLGSLVFVLLVLAFSPNYYLLLGSMFFAGLTFELTDLTNRGFMARNSEYKEMGEIDSALNGIGSLGSIIGPLLFGLILDSFSSMHSYFVACGAVLLMFMFVYRRRR